MTTTPLIQQSVAGLGFSVKELNTVTHLFDAQFGQLLVIDTRDPNGPDQTYPIFTEREFLSVLNRYSVPPLREAIGRIAQTLQTHGWHCVTHHQRPDGDFKVEWVNRGLQLTINVKHKRS